MSDRLDLTPTTHCWADAPTMAHGIELTFKAVPSAWVDEHQVDIHFPDGSVTTIEAEPEAGPHTFVWQRDPGMAWHVRLEPVRPNVLRLCLEDQHREWMAAHG